MSDDETTEIEYSDADNAGRLYARVQDGGIVMSAPDATDALSAASTAARLVAENLAGRYGDDAHAARMFNSASAFASDVVKFDSARQEGDREPIAHGQLVDVLLLGMAAGWFAETYRREHNEGGDPEDYQHAAAVMADAYDTLLRSMSLDAMVGKMDEVDHHYEDEM